MLRHPETVSLARKLTGPYISPLLTDDFYRLENNFFGIVLGPENPSGIALFLGARSGMEILRLRERMPLARIIVVEPNSFLRKEIAACVHAESDSLLLLASSLSEAFSARTKIDYVRVDIGAFKWEDIKNLLTQHDVGHIAGEFDNAAAAPLDLFRFCRSHSESFFWRMFGHETPLSGRGEAPEFEVSVVVPCYKVLDWVDHCMETLVNQSINSLEIIAVDDGSPDETGARLDEWAKRYPGRIRVIHKPNGGCASARNAGLMAARGEYVGFVDGDDWVEPPMFEALYTSAKMHAVDISQCGYTEVYEATDSKADFSTTLAAQSFGMFGVVGSPRDFLTVKPTIWRRLYKRDFLLGNSIKFPEHIRRFDDLPFQFEALACAKRVATIPDCYYNYRLERPGQDVAAKDVKLFVHFPIFKWLEERVGTWADNGLECALFAVKLNTHLWALSRMSGKLSGRYKALAAHDIYDNRCYMSSLQMLVFAARHTPHAVPFLMQAWILAKLAPPEMIASD